MLEGQHVAYLRCEQLISFLLDSSFSGNEPCTLAVREFCRAQGRVDRNLSTGDVLALTCVAGHKTSTNEPQAIEALISAVSSIVTRMEPEELAGLTHPASEPGDLTAMLADWIYVEHGRQWSRRRLHSARARSIAAKAIGVDLPVYLARIQEWAAVEPWTSILVEVDGEAIGGCIAIPVRKSCFERVRTGEINTWEIRARDVVSPSAYLIAEAFAMKPRAGAASERPPTIELWCGALAQNARLTAVKGSGEARPVHLLSADFSKRSERDLDLIRFRKEQSTLPNSPSHVRVRTIDAASREDGTHAFLGLWRMLQHKLRGQPATRNIQPQAARAGNKLRKQRGGVTADGSKPSRVRSAKARASKRIRKDKRG
jgi:hypothetical protein